jgi:uncharacterized protein
MEELRPTERTRVKRLPKRATYDRETINSILDEAMLCHVGFTYWDQPYVIPTLHVRDGEHLYIHGSAASRMLNTAANELPVCVTVTLIDGLVLARSAFHHSVNYRSVVIIGNAARVDDREAKLGVLRALVEKIAPGRWAHTRTPNDKELAATMVLQLPITEASAKVRTGQPIDDEEDYALPHWAGIVPLRVDAGAPIVDPKMPAGAVTPEHVRALVESFATRNGHR